MAEPQWDFPLLEHYVNGGEYTGSVSIKPGSACTEPDFRYRFAPDATLIRTWVWYGPLCFTASEMYAEGEFHMDEDGIQDANQWIQDQFREMRKKED